MSEISASLSVALSSIIFTESFLAVSSTFPVESVELSITITSYLALVTSAFLPMCTSMCSISSFLFFDL